MVFNVGRCVTKQNEAGSKFLMSQDLSETVIKLAVWFLLWSVS